MKLFLTYLQSRKRTLLACLSFALLLLLSFALYRLPLSAVLYPMALCILLGAAFLWTDFRRVKKLHECIQRLEKQTFATLDELPEPATVVEADYRALTEALCRDMQEKREEDYLRYQDMTEYYTVWAHQIKTPIAAMKLTLREEDSPLGRKLRSDLFRIEQYVEMVLAFLRLEPGSNDYVFREYRLDDILRPAIRKFAPEFIGRKLRLEYEPIDRSVVTDEKWLGFVVEQVLSNALKYTREGGIRVFMRENTLCIEDTGIGIASEDLPRIFEKGYTGYNGRTEKSASGIGLYLCKRICGNLGFSISAQSEPEKGTLISIDLSQNHERPE